MSNTTNNKIDYTTATCRGRILGGVSTTTRIIKVEKERLNDNGISNLRDLSFNNLDSSDSVYYNKEEIIMAILITYKGIKIVKPDPAEDGGLALNQNFIFLADSAQQINGVNVDNSNKRNKSILAFDGGSNSVKYWSAADLGLATTHQTATFVYEQIQPSSIWIIDHNMNRRPTVTLTDLDWNRVIADVSYPSYNQVVVNYTNPASGYALLNP